jgi:hypothetical protein
MKSNKKEKQVLGNGILHPPALLWRLCIDKQGSMWLCDKRVDPKGNLKEQGCVNCAELPFNCATPNA